MKYSIDDSLKKIEKKKKILIYKKEKRTVNALGCIVSINLAAIVAVFFKLTGFVPASGLLSSYGSLMLPWQAGGYIIVGVLCFMAAVIITLLCVKWKEKNNMKERDNDRSSKKEENF